MWCFVGAIVKGFLRTSSDWSLLESSLRMAALLLITISRKVSGNISVLSLKCIKKEKWIWSIQSFAALFTRTVQCIEIFSFSELYQWKYNLSTFFCFPFITHNLCDVGLVLFHWLLWVYWLTEFGILNECVVQNQLCIWFWGFVVVLLSHPWCNWLGNTIRTKWSAASKLKLS